MHFFQLKVRRTDPCNPHHSDKILKRLEGEMLEKQAMKSAVHSQQPLSGVICASYLTSSFDLASSLCPSALLLIFPLAFRRPYIK